ncbi:aspartate/glutamate racemase family protein [Marinovum sp.]|uniref:aspartate/glutamate racemase family protein n=1 Tax=Marinovum sp. TaxID=2024839 RepID=UPI002B271733|nr:aspartate/glutamate racemase family protein [Marinovum sp.]
METILSPCTAQKTARRRILVVNPNGNPEVTRLVSDVATRLLGPKTTVRVVYTADSPHSIENPADRSKAEPLALDLLAQHPGYDAYVMACFDDIAISGAREFLDVPILCAAEAAISLARFFAPRIAIVTTVETMVPGIRTLVKSLGAETVCSVRAAGIGVATAAAGGAEVEARLDAAIELARREHGAGAIILGSGGLTGRAETLSARHGLPVIGAIEASIALAEVLANLRTR